MTSSALLVMDVQRDVVAIADDGSGYLPRLRSAIDGARAAGIPVIYVVLWLRPGDPEVSPRNRVMTNAVRVGLFREGAPGTEIHDASRPSRARGSPRGGGARSRAATSTWSSELALRPADYQNGTGRSSKAPAQPPHDGQIAPDHRSAQASGSSSSSAMTSS